VPVESPRFEPVVRASVSDAVFLRLRDAVLTGEIAPGETLPAELRIADQFGVARHALREALRRLEQVGLVAVSHGGATRVLDWRTHAGLEVLPELTSAGPPPAEVLRSVLEMLLEIGRDAARLAASRLSDVAAAALRDHVDGTGRAVGAGAGFAELGERYEHLWRLVLLASDNLAYQLAYNSLLKTMHQYADLARRLGESEVGDVPVQRRLQQAIVAHDEDAAASAAEDLTARMLRNLAAG
jgi:DNA-binding FadR family transcriptional regulator